MNEPFPVKPTRRFRRRTVLGIYLFLLAASSIVRWSQGHRARPEPGRHEVITLPVYAAGETSTVRSVEMVYQDLRPVGNLSAPVVVLLHGSPMRSYDLQALADGLAGQFRVIAPELPGFGRSTRKVPDYSFAAHAAYVEQLVRALDVPRVHLVAYSQGGGIAFELQRCLPDRVASMSLISSIGVQEYELLGNYSLNRALHGLQLGFINTVSFLIPHFGTLDNAMLGKAYARNFYDSDMRPIRGYLQAYENPLLIIQGHEDFLVPPSAAREIHRLVPQSELLMKPGGHILVFRQSDEVASDIGGFIAGVEQGGAVTRATADPARVAKSREDGSRAADAEPAVGFAAFVMIMLIALSTFVSEDLACIGAGLLVSQGVIDYLTAATGAFFGIFIGDLLLYWAGYHWGRAALRRAPLRWIIKESAIRDSSKWFASKGPVVILTSRFVPGSRLPTYFTAGMLHTRFWQFFIYFLIAGLLWAPLLVWLAMKIGQQIIETLFSYKLYTVGVIALTVVLLWLLFKIVIPLFSFKGRRLLLSRWKRLVHWEFWPNWAYYPPVVAYILYLGARYRSFTLFTAANPGIPLSGFVGESKKDILDGLKDRRELIARYELIPAGMDPAEKEAAVIAFLDRHGMSFPVVLKPNAGQRGLGVAVIKNRDGLRRYLETPRPATIVQEYVPGFEFGVFYYRMPGQPRGHIYSITEKRFPSVIGDGKHDLEHLILKDPRAVCMAPHYIKMHDDRRFTVPLEDEVVQLAELGTHCRGAVFQDGRWVRTLELERTIDELSQGFDGFYFGRFDIRTPSIDNLRRGHGFKVIELNGVTSESTNMYDPSYGLFDAYAILLKQWHIAFKIGARNRKLGFKPATPSEFFRAIADYDAAPEA